MGKEFVTNIEKKYNVVLIPTNDNSRLVTIDGVLEYIYLGGLIGLDLPRWQTYHLHIISNETNFNTSDWVLEDGVLKLFNSKRNTSDCRLVVATTQPNTDLPIPTPDFLDNWCNFYNQGILKLDVNIEMPNYNKTIKITIPKTKKFWTREEVVILFEKFEEDRNHFYAEDAADILPLEDWIKNMETRIKVHVRPNGQDTYTCEKRGYFKLHWEEYMIPVLGWIQYIIDTYCWENLYRYGNKEHNTLDEAKLEIDSFINDIKLAEAEKNSSKISKTYFIKYP